MTRGPLALLLALMLAACAAERQWETATPVEVGFVSDEVIEVALTHELPAEVVELVSPEGRVYPADRISRDRVVTVEEEPGDLRPRVGLGLGLGLFGGGNPRVGTSLGLGIPLGLGARRERVETVVASRALIRVEDLAAYRTDWRDWTVRIRLGEPETDVRFLNVPAPPPPA